VPAVDVPEVRVEPRVAVAPASAALIVVDMQNDFVMPGGALVVADAAGTIPAIQRLLALARAEGMAVFFTQDTHDPGDPEFAIWGQHVLRGSWGWRIVDDCLQIKGGRGYETADSLRTHGERPDPVERMMRDWRINLLFEGSSEVMRLFIAREAVDTHLKVAGDLVNPKASASAKLKAGFRAASFYTAWYPKQWLGWGRWPRYGEFGPLATHLRFVNRASRKLARTLFHAMVRFGPRLEKKQAVLFRLVDVGAELLAISASCSRAVMMVGNDPGNRGPIRMADLVSRQSRRKVRQLFGSVFDNDDDRTYRLAQGVLRGEEAWLEEGMVRLVNRLRSR